MGAQARRARRQEIVDVGWRVVARRGYRNLTIDDVCAEAELSKGAFYTHFGQKQDLLIALLDDDAAGMEAIIEDVGESHASGVDRIRRYLRAAVERGEDPARVQMRADLWAELRADPMVGERFATTVRHRRALLAGWIREAVDSGELVEVPPNVAPPPSCWPSPTASCCTTPSTLGRFDGPTSGRRSGSFWMASSSTLTCPGPEPVGRLRTCDALTIPGRRGHYGRPMLSARWNVSPRGYFSGGWRQTIDGEARTVEALSSGL